LKQAAELRIEYETSYRSGERHARLDAWQLSGIPAIGPRNAHPVKLLTRVRYLPPPPVSRFEQSSGNALDFQSD